MNKLDQKALLKLNEKYQNERKNQSQRVENLSFMKDEDEEQNARYQEAKEGLAYINGKIQGVADSITTLITY